MDARSAAASPGRLPALRGIAARLAAGFAVVGMIAALLVATNWWLLDRLGGRFVGALDETVPRLVTLQDILSDIDELGFAARDALIASEPDKLDRALQRIESGRTHVGEEMDVLQRSLADDPGAAAQAKRIQTSSAGVLVALVKFSRKVKGGDKVAAAQLLDDTLGPKLRGLSEAMSEYRALQISNLQNAKSDGLGRVRQSQVFMLSMLAATVVAVTACSIFVARTITRPLAEAVRFGKSIAVGDLTAPAPRGGNDECGTLLATLGEMRDGLARIVDGVRGGCAEIANGSDDITRGNQALSQSTDLQAEGLRRTAAEATELAETVRRNAEHARQAATLAAEAVRLAQQGRERSEDLGRTIGEVNDRSARIATITTMIDSIAFQTNILALNAAVEAARAGESGRGFAVVAGEVRLLAQRSAAAAKDIKALVDDTTSSVQASASLADGTGRTIAEVSDAFARVARLVESISTESANQSRSIDKVRGEIGEIDTTTQRSAAQAQQVAATSQGVQRQARRLVDAVAVFRVADTGA